MKNQIIKIMTPEELKKKKEDLKNQILSNLDLEALNELEAAKLKGGKNDSVADQDQIWDNFLCGFGC